MKNDIDKAVEWAEREKRHKLNLIYDHKNTKCAETWEDEISHLKTLIQAAEAQKWQTIETAPRDGTQFLYVTDEGEYGLARWINGSWFSFGCDTETGLDIANQGAVKWRLLPNDDE